MLASGSLRERIEILRPVRTPNGSGGNTTSYTSLFLTYSKVDQKKASTDIIASQANIIQPFEFTIRYRLDPVIQIGDRILWRSRNFEILGFDWDIKRTWITITAKTVNESTSNGQV